MVPYEHEWLSEWWSLDHIERTEQEEKKERTRREEGKNKKKNKKKAEKPLLLSSVVNAECKILRSSLFQVNKRVEWNNRIVEEKNF